EKVSLLINKFEEVSKQSTEYVKEISLKQEKVFVDICLLIRTHCHLYFILFYEKEQNKSSLKKEMELLLVHPPLGEKYR
ncbi:hypothetical protein RFI_29793, partial [Reticulomyxa filosa]